VLTDHWYLRPQVRVQWRSQILGFDFKAVSAAVALGYRF